MDGLNHAQAYLIVTKIFMKINKKIDTILQKLQATKSKVNIEKNTFVTTFFEYLAYHISTSGICPLTSKVEAIQ
jgi:hypothetical protein